MGKLTISDLKFISPAVLYNWKAEQWTNRNGNSVWYWQGDPLFPVKVGPVMEKLESMGFMERLDIGIGVPCYRATPKAQSLVCNNCHKGRLFSDSDEDTGPCPVCHGLGIKWEAE